MRSIAAAGAATAFLLFPAAAGAVLPKPEKSYTVHNHQTPGDNWHVELKINKTGRQIVGAVLHAERCGRHTPFAENIVLTPEGAATAFGPLDEDDPEVGYWMLNGRFTAKHRFDGEFRFFTPDCDTGPMLFTAHSGAHKKGKHRHGSGAHSRHNMSGPAMGTKPDLSAAAPRARRQALGLYRRSLRSARARFPTYAAARRQGFVAYRRKWRRSVLFHVRSEAYDADGVSFDARRPESLVYWRRPGRRPVLVAFMYRRPVGRQPAFGRDVLGWHSHSRHPRATQMTHVWLTRGPRAGLANCLPVAALERALPRFRFRMGAIGVGQESRPC